SLIAYIHAFAAKIPQVIILSTVRPTMYLAGVKVGLNDGQQRIIATPPALVRFIGEPVTPRMTDRSAAAEEGWFPNIAKGGTSVYSTFSRVRATGWTVALLAPAAVVDAPRRRFLLLIIGGGLALSAVALGLAVGLGGRIAAPMKRLVTATQALSQGLPVV